MCAKSVLNAEELANYEVGKELKCDIFAEGDRVDVVGVEKGRGFQGVMRRHNFTGYVASHGAHEYQRHGGAIGATHLAGSCLPWEKNARSYGLYTYHRS
jgi:large subunit ribosomal protein L3